MDELMQAHSLFSGTRGQSALSRASGVPQPTISRLLKKSSAPEMETVVKLARPFGVTCEWLLTERGPKYVADNVIIDRDGRTTLVEAKWRDPTANSGNTEEVVNPSSPDSSLRVNNDLQQIAQRFADELLAAVAEGRVTEETLNALISVFRLGVTVESRGTEHLSMTPRARRGSRKRGTGT
ncbi:helix-turn-helix domain-containing protein [Burkholderia sp. JKS000303]|uniref:helix-turn-helix domain-containing protein n=1 Tax=Burkholderia sp. JKS000303 TaxID=1938747 RepID=UPI00211D2C95|nr:helix-turn-helix transcriptional regulator [Burkholderia sp. JKS000303]